MNASVRCTWRWRSRAKGQSGRGAELTLWRLSGYLVWGDRLPKWSYRRWWDWTRAVDVGEQGTRHRRERRLSRRIEWIHDPLCLWLYRRETMISCERLKRRKEA